MITSSAKKATVTKVNNTFYDNMDIKVREITQDNRVLVPFNKKNEVEFDESCFQSTVRS